MTQSGAHTNTDGRAPRREKSWKEMLEIISENDGEEVRVTTVKDTYVAELDIQHIDPLNSPDSRERPGYVSVFLQGDDFDPKISHEITSSVDKDRHDRHENDHYYEKLSVFKVFYDDEWNVQDEEWEKIVDIERL